MDKVNFLNEIQVEKRLTNHVSQSIIAEIIDIAKKTATIDSSFAKTSAECLAKKFNKEGDLPYHRIFESLYNYFTGNYVDAQKILLELVELEWPSKEILGYIFFIKGSNSRSLGELDRAVVCFNNALSLIELNGELEVFRGFCYYQFGGINMLFEDYSKAEENFLLSHKSTEYTQDQSGMFRSSIGLAELYVGINRFSEGKVYLEKTQSLVHDETTRAVHLNLTSIYFCKKEDYPSALKAINECIEIREKLKLKDAVSTSFIIKAEVLLGLNRLNEAIFVGKVALSASQKFKTRIKERDCYNILSKAHEQKENFEVAFFYLEKFELLNKEIIQTQYKDILKHKNTFITEQRNKIFNQHQEIKSSIAYSKNLQTAILPSDRLIANSFPNHFVLYMPKDIVAGDFYWISSPEMRPAENVEKDWTLFASADCTGHGVPGAIVSFICTDLLNRAVTEFKLIDPAQILDKVTELIIKRFGMNNHLVTDGMDISLAAYNKTTKELRWSGANNSLIYVSEGKLIDVKGDRQGIGYYKNIKPFTSHSFQMNKNDIVYLGTDGYPDQFGGDRGKKMSQKVYKAQLLQLHSKPLEKQKQELEKFLEWWSREEEQLDDICVLGVKF